MRALTDRIFKLLSRETLGNLLILLGGVAVLVAALHFIGSDKMEGIVEAAGWWGPAALILLKASTVVISPLGGGPLYIVGGAAFGFWNGLLYIIIEDLIGFTVAFYISRIFGRPVLKRFVGGETLRIVEAAVAEMSTPWGFFKTRFFFMALPEVTAYAGGLTTLSYPVYMFLQTWPHLIGSVVAVYIGHILADEGTSMAYFLAIIPIASVLAGFYYLYVKAKGRLE